ncbi:MAG: serine/threonine protein kinase [Candidatus Eisenbacteria bacterium]|uniref:Serine/threonine protein kinase n=1 Tax=Eiseniibacteriota bacterium TaxID=2212470 RepID=A0A956NEY4_UNCEI|nr:serine/threonine protein kinase [Candidatus Eisenbacteria bacterium]
MPQDETLLIGADRSDTSLRGASSFSDLTPEIQAQMYRRLGGLGLIYAGAWTANFLYFRFSAQAFGASGRAAFWYTTTAICVLAGIAVYVSCRGRKIPPRHFSTVATLFEVLGGFGIMAGFFGFEHLGDLFVHRVAAAVGIPPEDIVSRIVLPLGREGIRLLYIDGVTWVSVWLLAFPLLIPAPLSRTVLSTLLTAATVPAIMFASIWVNSVPPNIEPWIGPYILEATVPTFICAAIAIFSSRVVYQLTRDLSKARRMGSYHLVERIGAGGMGEVWKARHRLLARPAAVKLIRPETLGRDEASSQTAVRRFEREAQATSGLCSPHTIELYDFGIAEDGTFYYVMELLDGIDLKSLIERQGPIPPERVVHVLRQVCHSLHDAHRRGIVHRDIKPANIYLCRYGADLDFVKVLDFGLVKNAGEVTKFETQLTFDGMVCGTPGFMAPEAVTGSETVNPASDIYALGCVGYWLLTGQLVFEGDSFMDIVVKHAKDDPIPPSKRTETLVPPELEEIILRCLEKRPADRPSGARELGRLLERCAESLPEWSEARAEGWWETHLPAKADDVDAGEAEPGEAERGTAVLPAPPGT